MNNQSAQTVKILTATISLLRMPPWRKRGAKATKRVQPTRSPLQNDTVARLISSAAAVRVRPTVDLMMYYRVLSRIMTQRRWVVKRLSLIWYCLRGCGHDRLHSSDQQHVLVNKAHSIHGYPGTAGTSSARLAAIVVTRLIVNPSDITID